MYLCNLLFIIRNCRNRITFTAGLSLFLFLHTTQALSQINEDFQASSAERTINAFRIDSPIVMDGHLDESCWDMTKPATGFIQRELLVGEPATEKTEVRILYDDTNIYIGVYCYDSEPEHIIHSELRFDGNLENDDSFGVVLDTFNDQRNGFLFSVNPNGARLDASLGSSGRMGNVTVNRNWNGVWDTAASINDDGWSAELVIPFSTLRFKEVELQEWGINFRRLIVRKNEEVLWSAWGRDDGITQLSREGKLRNLRNIRRGRLLEVKPYLLSGRERREGKSDDELKYGIDVKYPITSEFTLDFTSFTDFAQIEADRTQINLTRFDLKYPEKRDFFIEGVDIFEFGSLRTTPFYSRRIGLTSNRRAVPILAGAKITGKTDKYSIGVLDVQTDEEFGAPSTNYSVFRIRRDILQKSSFGIIFTGVHDDTGHYDRVLGFDFTYRTDRFLGNKNFFISSDISENFRDDNSSGRRNAYLSVQYPNDQLYVMLFMKRLGENYNPEIGFIERSGMRKTDLHVRFRPRVKDLFIRQFQLPFRYQIYENLSGRIFSKQVQLPLLGFITKSEDTFTFTVTKWYEYLDEEFRLFKDVMIHPDGYEWWESSATFRSNRSRSFSTSISLNSGDFYNGTKKTFTSDLLVKFNEYLSVQSGAIYNKLALGPESFSTQEYNMRLNTNVSPRLAIRTFVQYNNDDELVNLNFRIHYIPQIGSDIYFVYNHIWDRGRDYKTTFDATVAKIAWRFEF